MAKEEAKPKKTRRPTALKRHIRSIKQRSANRAFKARVHTGIRSYEKILAAGDGAVLQAQLNAVYSLMDKGVKRGVFKQNKANRTKARLAQKAARPQTAS